MILGINLIVSLLQRPNWIFLVHVNPGYDKVKERHVADVCEYQCAGCKSIWNDNDKVNPRICSSV